MNLNNSIAKTPMCFTWVPARTSKTGDCLFIYLSVCLFAMDGHATRLKGLKLDVKITSILQISAR